MLCSEASVVNRGLDGYQAVTLRCRSWSCPLCEESRRKQLVALAQSGNPTTFITLSVNPAFGSGPADRARRLVDAWRTVVRRAKAEFQIDKIPFLAVFEATKKGEPHLHILARVKYIPQTWLADQMNLLMKAPVTDIRQVRTKKGVAYYISKYCGKEPQRFETCKRYWCSRDWEETPFEKEDAPGYWPDGWKIEPESLSALEDRWRSFGMEVTRKRHHVLAYAVGPPLPREHAYDIFLTHVWEPAPC